MNTMKKLFALLLALALVMSLAVPAMAADGYTITITDKFDGHIYEAYQIFDGDYAEGILSSIKWGSGIKTDAVTALVTALQAEAAFGTGDANEFKSVVVDTNDLNASAAAIAAKLVSWEIDGAKLKAFAKILHSYEKNADGSLNYLYLSDTKVTSTGGQSSDANGNAVYTISGLDGGYYMVKDKDGSLEDTDYDYYTRLILQVAGDVEIVPKGGVPSVDKKVHTHIDGTFVEAEDVAITDTFYFKLTGTMPANLEQYDEYTYEFADDMANQLMFSNEKFDGYQLVPGIASIYVERAGSSTDTITVPLKLSQNSEDADDDEHRLNLMLATREEDIVEGETDVLIIKDEVNKKLTVRFLNLRRSLRIISSDKIVIKYAAKFDPTAGDPDVIYGNGTGENANGNVNEVYVNFSNNPQGEGMGQTPPADSKVYTYQLNVIKTDDIPAPNSSRLSGAHFLLYQRILDQNDDITYKYAVLGEYDEDGEGGNPPVYIINDWITLPKNVKIEKETWEEDPDADVNLALNVAGESVLDVNGQNIDLENLVAITNTNGTLNIQGLDAVTYYLQELRAPATFNKLSNDINVTFTAIHNESDGKLNSLTVTANGKEASSNMADGSGTATITNSKGAVLPSTGGIGTTIFYVAGGLLVVAAITLLITKKRMSEK